MPQYWGYGGEYYSQEKNSEVRGSKNFEVCTTYCHTVFEKKYIQREMEQHVNNH